MLTAEQVLPFLLHDDRLVRTHALRYFEDAHDVGPLTADHLWAVIDRFGETVETAGVAAVLRGVPHTHASLQRLARALAPGAASEVFEFHYQHVARDISFPVLERHRDELFAIPTLLPHVRAHLELRLSLAGQPTAPLYDRLMDRGRELRNTYAGQFDMSPSDALIEAIGRAADPEVLHRALSTLEDPDATADWREIFAVRVLGEARHAPAIADLVDRYLVDGDILREEVSNALARIGTTEVIDRIVAFYPGKRWDVRLYADDPIRRIKRPESVAALMKLLAVELELSDNAPERDDEDEWDDDDGEPLIDHILQALNDVGSLTAHDVVVAEAATDPDHPELIEVCEGMLATAIMAGVTLPEAAAWRERSERHEAELSPHINDLKSSPSRFRDYWRQTGIDTPPSQPPKPSPRWVPEPAPTYDRVETIRNTEPKVGRNDPCPCGSGKKHKKCCGAPK